MTELIQTVLSSAKSLGADTLAEVNEFTRSNPLLSAAILSGGGLVISQGVSSLISRRKKTKKNSKSSRKRKRASSTRRRVKKSTGRKGRRTPRTAGKGKDRSTKRIRYTKKGQPYVITRSGKAKFIKKTSASRSHRKKGGRY